MNERLTISLQERNMISLLRVIATLGVLLVHVNQRAPLPGILGNIASFGADGVKCYFFLTGYLVMASWHNRKSTGEYWEKRICRTFPIYYFFLLLFLIFRFDWLQRDVLSIPRALFMLQYIAPPTVSYEYCAMNLLGVLAIFMTFYLAIPVLAKWIRSLDSAFVAFWGIIIFKIVIDKFYHLAYDPFCPTDAVTSMSNYFGNSLPYFAAGILAFYGKREQKQRKLLVYMLFIAVCGVRYSFLNMRDASYVCLMLTILICCPPTFAPQSCLWKAVKYFDHTFGMGVFLTQVWCFDLINKLNTYYDFPAWSRSALMIVLPYCAAFVLHYIVEKNGEKLVKAMFKRFSLVA